MVTGTSVLGLKFEGRVVIAADMLGSHGLLGSFPQHLSHYASQQQHHAGCFRRLC